MMRLFAGARSLLGIIEHLKDVLTIIRCKVSILWSGGFLAHRLDDPLIVAGYLDSLAAGTHWLLCWHYRHQEKNQDLVLFFVAGIHWRLSYAMVALTILVIYLDSFPLHVCSQAGKWSRGVMSRDSVRDTALHVTGVTWQLSHCPGWLSGPSDLVTPARL